MGSWGYGIHAAAARPAKEAVTGIAILPNFGPVATPVIWPPSGQISTTQEISIVDATAGAAIYYSTNGGTATACTGPFSISAKESKPVTVLNGPAARTNRWRDETRVKVRSLLL
ncbi:MAG: chitobiase/beta-hexosaminidase C-terminal domain-containing protein [Capsulimonadaceae bacterium]